MCRLFPSRIRSACRCRTPTMSRPCITACRTICSPSGTGSGGYLAFLGRISPEKAPDAAIRIAAQAGMPLKIAAKVDRVDEEYFKSTIEPLLTPGRCGIRRRDRRGPKEEFLGNAAALLFPIAWREPFGLVMIEAMACGTPVIAFDNGSVPEVLEEGVTGFIVHDEQQAVEAVRPDRRPRPKSHPRGIRPALHRAPHGAELPRSVLEAREGASLGGQGRGPGRRRRNPRPITGNMRSCCTPPPNETTAPPRPRSPDSGLGVLQ